ncbi:MAG: glycosyl hydrolase, partial [Bryobacteraceae bacterium]
MGTCCALLTLCLAAQGAELKSLHNAFVNPPANSRIMMRWWWFGPAVTDDELARELRQMKAAGIGGVEIQTVYPLNLDDPAKHFRNLPYLSDDYLHALHFAYETAKQLGLRVDLTLASGWPYGGAEVPVNEAAGKLRVVHTAIPAEARSVPIPAVENGEQLLAAFAMPQSRRLQEIQKGRVQIPQGTKTVLFFIASRTGQQVKRAAVGAEGFVLDHYDRDAVQDYLAHTGARLLSAFLPGAPYAVFSDSLEVFGSDWTSGFLSRFRKLRGYDLTPYLPALAENIGPKTMALRHDWGETLTDLADTNYLTQVHEWAHAHHTLFRSQTYGVPPVILSSNALVDLPEGEGAHWRQFAPARWAASASHLYGRKVTSAETWTWIHPPPFRATPLDLKQEADRMFLQGINQLVGHGWPYSPPSAGEPGWTFYASGALNAHNPWFEVMPDLARYLQRISFLLRQGKPDNDIALYLPTDDAWAGFTLGRDSVDRSMPHLLGPEIIPQILNAGFNFDFIDDRAIAKVGIPYRIVILPGVERMPVATAEKLRDYVAHGGIVIATRCLPSLAPGLLQQKTGTPQLRKLIHKLFARSNPHARLISSDSELSAALRRSLKPDFAVASDA